MKKLKILMIALDLPFPPRGGATMRNWQNLKGLLEIGDVAVLSLLSAQGHPAPQLEKLLLWHSFEAPDIWRSSNEEKKIWTKWISQPFGLPYDYYFTQDISNEFGNTIEHIKPDIVILEELFAHRLLDSIIKYGCPIILDCHNVEYFLWTELFEKNKAGTPMEKAMARYMPLHVKKVEKRLLNVAQQVWVCSKEDESLISRHYAPEAPITIIPNGINPDEYSDIRYENEQLYQNQQTLSKKIIFPATFSYLPNRNAALFLINQLFPALVDLYPESRLLLVGADPFDELLEASEKDARIVVTGRVASIIPYLAEASVMVTPIFEGSGTRLKILEAFAAKIPVISSLKGAEGLEAYGGKQLIFAETADEFVQSLQKIWENPNLAADLTFHGYDFLLKNYSWETAFDKIEKSVTKLIN